MTDHRHFQDRARLLHDLGLKRQWDAATVVEWSEIDLQRVSARMRRTMAEVYCDILYAERFGLEIAKRLVELAPEGPLRDFAGLQVIDEMRHVDFFERMTAKLGEETAASPELLALRQELSGVADYEELLLHAQVLEAGARALFVGNAKASRVVLERQIKLPGSDSITRLLGVLVDFIGRDESRHIAFGYQCLKRRLDGVDAGTMHRLEDRARVSSRLMYDSFASRAGSFRRLGLNPSEVLERVWSGTSTQLQRLEFDIGAPALQ